MQLASPQTSNAQTVTQTANTQGVSQNQQNIVMVSPITDKLHLNHISLLQSILL